METNEEKLKTTTFFIEATSYERFSLWKEHHEKEMWEEDNMGFWTQIGQLGKGKPVCVSFSFAKLWGTRICFYDVTSRYSDYTMVENYIKDNYPVKWDNGTRVAMTDAMNFHLALGFCRGGK